MKILFGLATAFLVFVILDVVTSSTHRYDSALVIDRHYKPTHVRDEWVVICRLKSNGKVVAADATPNQWADCEPGRNIRIDLDQGGISGWTYGYRVAPEPWKELSK